MQGRGALRPRIGKHCLYPLLVTAVYWYAHTSKRWEVRHSQCELQIDITLFVLCPHRQGYTQIHSHTLRYADTPAQGRPKQNPFLCLDRRAFASDRLPRQSSSHQCSGSEVCWCILKIIPKQISLPLLVCNTGTWILTSLYCQDLTLKMVIPDIMRKPLSPPV